MRPQLAALYARSFSGSRRNVSLEAKTFTASAKNKALSATTIIRHIAAWRSCFSASTRCVFANLIGGEKNSLGAKKKDCEATRVATVNTSVSPRHRSRERGDCDSVRSNKTSSSRTISVQFLSSRSSCKVASSRAPWQLRNRFRSHLKLEENEPKCTRGTC